MHSAVLFAANPCKSIIGSTVDIFARINSSAKIMQSLILVCLSWQSVFLVKHLQLTLHSSLGHFGLGHEDSDEEDEEHDEDEDEDDGHHEDEED